MTTPGATYRLQFHKEFGFDAAAQVAPYLARLGVTHLYASPFLKARPGSTHGYDIVAHDELNPELGDDSAFQRMIDACQANGLQLLLDFVPNHMGVGGADNPLWLDVLEWGESSAFAGWFDIDWEPDRKYLRQKLLVPFLGGQYGVELEQGKLLLKLDANTGELAVWAYDAHKLPICPLDYAQILGHSHPQLERLGDEFAALLEWRPQVSRRANELKAELADVLRNDAEARAALVDAIAVLNGNPDEADPRHNLDAIIQNQNWRTAHFRVAGDDINYRRFFNINDLAGIRIELPDVFEHTHRLLLKLLHLGSVTGVRVDHIDGLLDPKQYLERLCSAAKTSGAGELYLVVEKILGHAEPLPEDWPVHGTTGYEFANLALQLLIDPEGETNLTRFYLGFTGERSSFPGIVRRCKLRIMRNEMASELNVLARDAARVARQNPKTADFTHNVLRRALGEVLSCFPVYRTYVDSAGRTSAVDARYLSHAVAEARRNERDIDPTVFDFLSELVSGALVQRPRSGFSRHAVLRCAMKFQQYSGPVMAKGLEDTAFYRYNRFIALNEVGGQPDRFGIALADFHEANATRAQAWPHTLLATATHDTKRGEDARARLAVLSEMSAEWPATVQEWHRILRGAAPTDAPDANDEYFFYQSLVGAWPPEFSAQSAPDEESLLAFAERMKQALTKAVREAKRHSSWGAPNAEYEAALIGLIDRALMPGPSNTFLESFIKFQRAVEPFGVSNSLVQAVLKFTAPGIPDLYQGAELWDFSLVDPDNRRPVDFAARERGLKTARHELPADKAAAIDECLAHWQSGRIKLSIIATLLALRKRHPAVFADGAYEACVVDGPKSDAVCAFVRHAANVGILIVLRRFPVRHHKDPTWQDTRINVPVQMSKHLEDVFTGARFSGQSLDPADVFAHLPVAVLVTSDRADVPV